MAAGAGLRLCNRRAYLSVTRRRAENAVRVLDRLHIMQKRSKAIDKVRAAEARSLKAAGSRPLLKNAGSRPLLKNARWLLLKWRRNLSAKQVPRLEEILQHNLNTVRAYLLKEEFRQFFALDTP